MKKEDQITGQDYEIEICELEIYAFHGAFPEEKKLGQRFLIDLALQVRSSGNLKEDSLDKVLSYAEITSEVHSIFTSKAYNLLETVANDILLGLAAFPEIKEAKIKVTKTSPPIPYTMAGVSVCLTKTY